MTKGLAIPGTHLARASPSTMQLLAPRLRAWRLHSHLHPAPHCRPPGGHSQKLPSYLRASERESTGRQRRNAPSRSLEVSHPPATLSPLSTAMATKGSFSTAVRPKIAHGQSRGRKAWPARFAQLPSNRLLCDAAIALSDALSGADDHHPRAPEEATGKARALVCCCPSAQAGVALTKTWQGTCREESFAPPRIGW